MKQPKERIIELIYDKDGELLVITSMNLPDSFRRKVIDRVKDLRTSKVKR